MVASEELGEGTKDVSGRAHLLVAVVTVGTVGFVFRLVRQRALAAKYSFLWLTLGAGLVMFAVAPGILDRVSLWLGISYAPATFLFLAVVLLLLVAVHFSWELSRLEERTRSLAEMWALHTAMPPRADARSQGSATGYSDPRGEGERSRNASP